MGFAPCDLAAVAAAAVAKLRPYQHDALTKLRESIRAGHRAPLLVLPTGGGKTVIALAIIAGHIARGGTVLFVAHRAELINQCAETLARAGIPRIRKIFAGDAVGPAAAEVTVASVQTIASKRWIDRLPASTLVVFDEAHHVKSKTWMRIATHFASAIIVGLTATPQRSDGSPMGDVFDDLIVVATMRELIDAGHLVQCDVYAPIAGEAESCAEDPVEAYRRFCDGKRTVVFAPTLPIARELAARFTADHVQSDVVDGTMSLRDRTRALARFREGAIRVLCNVFVLTEGWDDPGVEACILTRACTHDGTYLQLVGRVVRLFPGKDRAILVDLRGATHRHGLPDADRSYSLEGKAIRLAALPALKQCLSCGYTGVAWVGSCPRCKVKPDPKEEARLEVERQAIDLVTAKAVDTGREYWLSLLAKAEASQYKRGWVSHQYKLKFGHWPPFKLTPADKERIASADVASLR